MLANLFTTKKVLSHDLGYCKLFDTTYNGKDCTKMYFTINLPTKYERLRSVSQPNILPVYKITAHSIFTKRVAPFSAVYDRKQTKYNEYVLARLRDAITFIHEELRLEHCNLVMDALFIDNYGNVLIGKFDDCVEYKSSADDDFLLNELANTMLGRDIATVGEGDVLFRTLEDKDAFQKLTVEEKKTFVMRIVDNKEPLLDRIYRNLVVLLLDDISGASSPEYKVFVLDALMALNKDILLSFTTHLFSILDSSIRIYLLQNLPEVDSLGECVPQLCLGLRVKDKRLKHETIAFLFRNEGKFSSKAFAQVLKAVQEDVVDSESIALACSFLSQLERSDVDKPIYKLVLALLVLGKARAQVYQCIDKFFPRFDKYKISTELLPPLCANLTEPDAQDFCFTLVEKILSFLKSNKADIRSKDWTLKSIKSMFVTKKQSADTDVNTRMMQLSKSDVEESWDEEEIL